jgi:Ca2+ transporting ATPase
MSGRGKGIVLVVGPDSCVGKIQVLVAQDAEATPLQQKLETIARDIGKLGLIAASLTLLVLVIRFIIDRASQDNWNDGSKWVQLIEYFIVAVTVVVVAIPEGLPLAVTLSLAFSVKQMLRDNNLVRKLQATETMGGANAICSDKTGTLTQNKMTLTSLWNGKLTNFESYDSTKLSALFPEAEHQQLLREALACNNIADLKTEDGGSKTEVAMLEFLQRCGEDYEALRKIHCPEGFYMIPFTSDRKRHSTILENVNNGLPSKKRIHIKGASEIVLYSCDQFYSFEDDTIKLLTEDLKSQIEHEINKMADQALRTICFGYKEIDGDEDLEAADEHNVKDIEKSGFILLGVLGIRDILRKEVKGAVAKCKIAGIKVRMVTGDNKITARAIARECGIVDPNDEASIIMEGPEFIKKIGGVVCKKCQTQVCDCPRDKETASKKKVDVRVDTIANGAAFDAIYKNLDVLARSKPEDKYALVTGLIERGHVVAVTGDGTNDAPALRKADVGFAMNVGTEIAKEAADIILLDNNFASIVEAVKWGRNIYDNIKKFLQFQLTVNIVAVTITLIGAAVLKEAIIKAVNMLWINLIMDTLASLALATEPPTEELLNRKPHNRNEYILSKTMMKHILGQAILQLTILLILVFTGDSWIPEDLPLTIDPKTHEFAYYSAEGYVRSGRGYFISGGEDDYRRFDDDYGPSRHFTVIFNTFVWMQIFNFLNARKLKDEINVVGGIQRNPMFMGIVVLIIVLQIILAQVGGRALNVSTNGMNVSQWFIGIGLAAIGLIWSVILKVIPFQKFCPKLGNKQTDPLKSGSKILSVKRTHSQGSLTRKFSNLQNSDKHSSLSKVQRHNPNSQA